jgi:hypothetical protein
MTNDITVACNKYQSEEELQRFSQDVNVPFIFLGEQDAISKECFCLEINMSGKPIGYVAVLSSPVGLKPGWFVGAGDRLIIGFNDSIAIVALQRIQILQQTQLLSLFWEFLQVETSSKFIALCETAVISVSDLGEVLWRVDTDLISDFKVCGPILKLKFYDADSAQVDLLSGRSELTQWQT